MRRRGTAGAILCVGLALLVATPSRADTADVTVGKSEIDLKPTDGGGTGSIALTNLTDSPITVTAVAKPPAPDGCTVDLDNKRPDVKSKNELPPQQTVTFTVTATSCGEIKDALQFGINAGGKPLPRVTAKVAEVTKINWTALWWGFVLALVVAAILMFGTWKAAESEVKEGLEKLVTDDEAEDPSWKSALPYLKDTWSFKDSWASNVTLVAGLVAGVFGSSDVLKGALGDKTDESLTLATVGGAVAAGLIGLAGVVAIGFKTMKDGKFTPRGVLLGSTIALGAAGGQVVVIYLTASKLELGLSKGLLLAFSAVVLGILGWYGYASVRGVLVQGATPIPVAEHDPVAEPVSETVFSAALIAASTKPDLDRADVDKLLKQLQRPADKEGGTTAIKSPTLQELVAAPAMINSGRALLP
jgi:hypothetical protein